MRTPDFSSGFLHLKDNAIQWGWAVKAPSAQSVQGELCYLLPQPPLFFLESGWSSGLKARREGEELQTDPLPHPLGLPAGCPGNQSTAKLENLKLEGERMNKKRGSS